ncbi:MAG: hypothetical protein R2724_12990 [Bryobacterales bacterium]
MDSAAACAALFLNIYYLEAWPIPWPLAASPLKLLLFSTVAGVPVPPGAAFSAKTFLLPWIRPRAERCTPMPRLIPCGFCGLGVGNHDLVVSYTNV